MFFKILYPKIGNLDSKRYGITSWDLSESQGIGDPSVLLNRLGKVAANSSL